MSKSEATVDDTTVATGVVDLADGRRLAYRWLGAAPTDDGPVVVHNHGGLSSSLDANPCHETAAESGVRVLVPDRPGVAGSDRNPGHTTADWASDVRALLDELGIDRCTTTGWSMGGQYAMALGALLPDRVQKVAVLAGCPPLDDPDTLAELNKIDAMLLKMSRHRPARARRVFRLMHRMEERSAGKLAHRPARKEGRPGAVARAWGPPDAEVLAGPFGPILTRASADGLANDEGQVDEYLAFGGSWGFDPSTIGVPVCIWQGDADRFVPEAWATKLADLVPDGTVQACPGEGHLAIVSHWPDILRWLAS